MIYKSHLAAHISDMHTSSNQVNVNESKCPSKRRRKKKHLISVESTIANVFPRCTFTLFHMFIISFTLLKLSSMKTVGFNGRRQLASHVVRENVWHFSPWRIFVVPYSQNYAHCTLIVYLHVCICRWCAAFYLRGFEQ